MHVYKVRMKREGLRKPRVRRLNAPLFSSPLRPPFPLLCSRLVAVLPHIPDVVQQSTEKRE